MYTGSYDPKIQKNSRFAQALCIGLVAAGVLLAALVGSFWLFDFSVEQNADGGYTLSAGNVPQNNPPASFITPVSSPVPVSPLPGSPGPLAIVDVPRPSVPVVTDASGREVLTASGVYKKAVAGVTGVLSVYPDGTGSGTGIIMTTDGYIITNHHVVDGATSVEVVLHDGQEYPATVVGSDRLTDLAVLKIDATGLSPVEFGNSETLEHGDSVVVIGNPLGMELQNTLTNGIISGINRDITLEDISGELTMTVLQTNCAVNPGNSGGPLLNMYGQVVGIVSSKIMGDSYQNVEGLGFAIPITSALPVLNELMNVGYVQGRPALGISVDMNNVIDPRTAQYYGMPTGLLISYVNPKSDAYTKGLRANDILTHVNDQPVASLADVNSIKNNYTAGDSLKLTIYRRGETLEMEVVLMEEGMMK